MLCQSRVLMMNRADNSILEQGNQIGQEAGIKRLTILESNNDLFCLMMFDVGMKRLQVIIEIFATLPHEILSVTFSSLNP